jgi:vacuolar-type H+-ATPase subunit D/Vma8
MNGFDIQSALSVAKQLRGIARRADTFGHNRERLLEEILFMAENYEKIAEMIEASMEREFEEFSEAA